MASGGSVFEDNYRLSNLVKRSRLELLDIWKRLGFSEIENRKRDDSIFNCPSFSVVELIREKEIAYRILGEWRNILRILKQTLRMEGLNVSEEKSKEMDVFAEITLLAKAAKELLNLKLDREHKISNLRLIRKELLSALDMLSNNENTDNMDESILPSLEKVKELESRIDDLRETKERREKEFGDLQRSIKELVNYLELSPTNDFEDEILTFNMRNKNVIPYQMFSKARLWLLKLVELQCENETVLNGLKLRLTSLWDELRTQQKERNEFLSNNKLCGKRTIKIYRREVDNLKKLTSSISFLSSRLQQLKKELLLWWDKCMVSESDRNAFEAFREEKINEDLLKAHELEVKKWRSIYEENSILYDKIEARRNLSTEKSNLEINTGSLSRWNNRKCVLLNEEKRRKQVDFEISKLELEIISLIMMWEARRSDGRKFLIDGMSYHEFFSLHQCANDKSAKKTVSRKIAKETTPKGRTIPVNQISTSKSEPKMRIASSTYSSARNLISKSISKKLQAANFQPSEVGMSTKLKRESTPKGRTSSLSQIACAKSEPKIRVASCSSVEMRKIAARNLISKSISKTVTAKNTETHSSSERRETAALPTNAVPSTGLYNGKSKVKKAGVTFRRELSLEKKSATKNIKKPPVKSVPQPLSHKTEKGSNLF